MKDYNDVISSKRRLTILRFLADDPAYCLNTSVIKTLLNEHGGFSASSAMVKNDFNYIEEQGLIVQSNSLGIIVGKITERGIDVSKGFAKCDGIARPSPE